MGLNILSRKAISVFFEYDTPKIVHIRSKKVGVFSRLIQMCIVAYVIGFVMVYKKGYQEIGYIESAVTTKVKGVTVTNYSLDELHVPEAFKKFYNRVWDVTEYVIPPSENEAFFVMTNVIITPNQTYGFCDEDPDIPGILCNPLNNTCKPGINLLTGNGKTTGRCINSTQKQNTSVCEIAAWCPVEVDDLPLGDDQAILSNSENYTVLIKNSIDFPKFGSKYKRNNILQSSNSSYLKSCQYNKDTDPFCPVFRLRDIVSEAGENYTVMAVKGGVMSITILWNCDLDWDFMTYCRPKYTFRRLDDPLSKISPGWNFRFSYNHEFDRRTLLKAYGIRFVIDIQGQAGKFNVVPTMLNIGTGLALMSITTIICDIIVLYFAKSRRYYKEKKYLDVEGDDAFHTETHERLLSDKRRSRSCSSERNDLESGSETRST